MSTQPTEQNQQAASLNAVPNNTDHGITDLPPAYVAHSADMHIPTDSELVKEGFVQQVAHKALTVDNRQSCSKHRDEYEECTVVQSKLQATDGYAS
jgi:hypothetical protein